MGERARAHEPKIPVSWRGVVELFWPAPSAANGITGLASVLSKMEDSRLELDWESNQMNGEGDYTCSVSIPGNISSATVHLPNANHAMDVHLPLIGIGTGDAFWEVPGTTDRDDAPVGFGYPDARNATAVRI